MKTETKLQVFCSWCSKYMGEKPGMGEDGASHSICPDCLERNFPDVYQKMYGDIAPDKLGGKG